MKQVVRAAAPPSIPSPWRLTELDAVNITFVLRGAWLFDRRLDAERLVDGLRRTLSFYPHLAGRMSGSSSVNLGNQGVPFTEKARPELSVVDVVANPALGHRFADRIRPPLVRVGGDALLKIVLTQLRDGSLLNVSCSHGCVDGRAFYAFVQSWARACAGLEFPQPVLDTSCIPAPGGRPRDAVVTHALAAGWPRLRLGTILGMVVKTAFSPKEPVLAATFTQEALRRLPT